MSFILIHGALGDAEWRRRSIGAKLFDLSTSLGDLDVKRKAILEFRMRGNETLRYSTKVMTLITCLALSGCMSTTEAESYDLNELPEVTIHINCLNDQLDRLISSDANAVDIGYIAATNCDGTRRSLAKAMAKANGTTHVRVFVDTFLEEGKQSDIAVVAETVISKRGY